MNRRSPWGLEPRQPVSTGSDLRSCLTNSVLFGGSGALPHFLFLVTSHAIAEQTQSVWDGVTEGLQGQGCVLRAASGHVSRVYVTSKPTWGFPEQ